MSLKRQPGLRLNYDFHSRRRSGSHRLYLRARPPRSWWFLGMRRKKFGSQQPGTHPAGTLQTKYLPQSRSMHSAVCLSCRTSALLAWRLALAGVPDSLSEWTCLCRTGASRMCLDRKRCATAPIRVRQTSGCWVAEVASHALHIAIITRG